MQQLISIILPAYNAARFLSESVQSVLNQTYTEWELVIVDDGSTDNTAAIGRSFAESDKRIRYLFQQNGGQAAARNKGLQGAGGDLVAFIDADDLWEPEKLELQLNVLRSTEVDLVNTDGYIFSDTNGDQENEKFAIVPGKTKGAEMFRLLFAFNRIATLSVLVKRKALEAVGLFDEDRTYQNCEDYDLWMRLAKNGASFYGMQEKLMRYRRHPTATTYTASKLLRPMLAVILKHAGDPSLDASFVKQRVRGLYRDLISALVNEGNLDEARDQMHQFSMWDRGAVITKLQRLLLLSFPRQFNYLSRECLYRAEWHLRSVSKSGAV